MGEVMRLVSVTIRVHVWKKLVFLKSNYSFNVLFIGFQQRDRTKDQCLYKLFLLLRFLRSIIHEFTSSKVEAVVEFTFVILFCFLPQSKQSINN